MKPEVAFDVCHDVYLAAREALDGSLGTTNLESRDKYLWRPDIRPRLAEYSVDFALAGRRALAGPALASRATFVRNLLRGLRRTEGGPAALGDRRNHLVTMGRRCSSACGEGIDTAGNVSAAGLLPKDERTKSRSVGRAETL